MDAPPIKPRREKKFSREVGETGLLVSVIRTLDLSETDEQREREKLKIEKEFKKSDQRLNELVSHNDGDLTKVMQLFNKASSQVTAGRERIRTVKENLQACKQLLRCRREELQKMYTDAVQHKCVLEMLDQINEIQKVPQQVVTFLNKKQYLHATKTLVSAIKLSKTTLREVEGLSDLRQDFENKRNMVYNKLIEELNKHLYHSSTSVIFTSFQRQGSTRGSNLASPFQRNMIRRSAERIEANTKARKALFEIQQNGYIDVDKSEIIEDTELLDADVNSTYFIGIIVECFALLEKVPESIETIKVQMQPELLTIVTKTTQYLKNNNLKPADRTNQEKDQTTPEHPLLTLLDLVYKQFKLIAETHALTLKNYQNTTKRYNMTGVTLYDSADYWHEAQAVMQIMLTDYLNIQSVSAEEQLKSSFPEERVNINSFFSRRKPQTNKKLFKFEKSDSASLASNLPNFLSVESREHKRSHSNASNPSNPKDDINAQLIAAASSAKKREKILLCEADPALIRTIYLPLMQYIAELEDIFKAKTGDKGPLNAFLTEYVRDTFLARGHNRNLQATIETVSKANDAWRTIISPEEMKRLGLNRPLLQSTVLVESRIADTKQLIVDLPTYSDDLLKMVCSLLKTYRETCQVAYRGIVQPETEDKRIYSVAWLKDDDINRFLKTLPNWTDLKASGDRMRKGRLMKGESMEEESPTQIQQRNIREAEMLTTNLGEGGISSMEILSDIGVLKELAILQESMEWFANRIADFANDLKKPVTTNGSTESSSAVKDGTIKVLTNLALEFEELANTCLLVLHLEVRVQCFHYLRSNTKNKEKSRDVFDMDRTDSLEPDAKVLKLTKVLSDMDEALSSTLHPRKTKYVFEGLAHLVARILIMASNSMERIDNAGVQKMVRNALAIQQTLSSITASREVALDHARNFYEMFYLDPDEFINQIVEKGAQFTEMQYLHALQLVCKSRYITDSNTLASYQQRLSDLLGTKPSTGVSV
ncbi:exocyst complex component 4 [Culicoides brevitarsis]|uniref:exocyst complex component 4 n=1 Tax=Culicoides brevitarsis TaxID=469753 RepID=UPI00307B73E4